MPQTPIQTKNIGPDGVLEWLPTATNPKYSPLYLDLSKGDPTSKVGPFAITYGSEFVSSNIIQGINGATCLETNGAVQHYKPDKNGCKKPDGRSMRALTGFMAASLWMKENIPGKTIQYPTIFIPKKHSITLK